MNEKVYTNEHERRAAELARARGWRVTKRGWPDFMCFGPKGEVIALEVKPANRGSRNRIARLKSRLNRLKREQAACMAALHALGLKCYVTDGLRFEPFDPERHGR